MAEQPSRILPASSSVGSPFMPKEWADVPDEE